MRKQVLITVILLLNVLVAYCQLPPPFGQQFKTWVETDATSESTQLCNADYRQRLQNTFQISYDQLASGAINIDSLLNVIYRHMLKTDSLTNLGDTTSNAIKLSAEADSISFLLLNIQSRLDTLSTLRIQIDSIGSLKFFEMYGLGHVGRENLMESYFELGDKFKSTFNQKFDNYFYISVSSDGLTQVSTSADNSKTREEFSAGFSAGGIAGGNAICGPVCGAVGGLIGGFIGNFVGGLFSHGPSEDDIKNEYAKQKELVNEGLNELPDKLLSNQDMYKIFKANYDTISTSDIFISQKRSVDSMFSNLPIIWKEIFALNAKRIIYSNALFTDSKISMIQKNFASDPNLQTLFNESIQRQAISDVEKEFYRLNLLEDNLSQPTGSSFQNLANFKQFLVNL